MHRSILVFLLALSVAVTASAKSSWEEGKELIDQGKFKEAIPKLEAAIPDHPDSHELYFTLAVAHFRAKNYAKAIAEVKTTMELHPDKDEFGNVTDQQFNDAIRPIMAISLLKGKELNYDETLKYLRPYVKDSGNHKAMLAFITKVEQAGETAKAHDLVMEFLKSQPNSLLARNKAAKHFVQNKQWSEAIEQFEAVHKIIPEEYGPVAQLIKLYKQTGNEKKAMQYAEVAAELNSDDPKLTAMLARDAFESKKWRQAGKLYGQLAEMDNSAESAKFAAQAYDQIENFSASAKYYRMAIKAGDNDCSLHNRLGIALERLGQYENAMESYQEAIRICGLGAAADGLERCKERLEKKRLEEE